MFLIAKNVGGRDMMEDEQPGHPISVKTDKKVEDTRTPV
jgi:hypothetical protein